ncbi:MAG: OadG family protein [Candidatus Atribacteria bacterium]|nr:OadG family protein [Candidatus Atribacteria bacterium]
MYVGIRGAIMLTIIAMSCVFLVLGLLALMMVALRKIVGLTSSKKKEIKDDAGTTLVPDSTSGEKEDRDIIAVISAAISSYFESESVMQPIRILNIRRITPLSLTPWAMAGKQNQMLERNLIRTRKKGGF